MGQVDVPIFLGHGGGLDSKDLNLEFLLGAAGHGDVPFHTELHVVNLGFTDFQFRVVPVGPSDAEEDVALLDGRTHALDLVALDDNAGVGGPDDGLAQPVADQIKLGGRLVGQGARDPHVRQGVGRASFFGFPRVAVLFRHQTGFLEQEVALVQAQELLAGLHLLAGTNGDGFDVAVEGRGEVRQIVGLEDDRRLQAVSERDEAEERH